MIVIKLKGGLGNQLFQFAYGKKLSLYLGGDVYFDTSEIEKKQKGITKREFQLGEFKNISFNLYNSKSLKLLKIKVQILNFLKISKLNYKLIKEPKFGFTPDLVQENDNLIILDGFWQSFMYFNEIRDEIIYQLGELKNYSTNYFQYYNLIKSNNYISVHIRRGDYITSMHTNSFHGVCSESYFFQAIRIILDMYPDTHLMFFSDDMVWVKNMFKDLPNNKVFVECTSATEDLMLMKNCSHNIISNSTFSWWGAWLNQNKGKIVVAPQKWFNSLSINIDELIPREWIKI